MKAIIAGGRDYKFSDKDIENLDSMKDIITEVVCGMARGADSEGKIWAESNDIIVSEFPAKWDEYGLSAGHIRNREMAEYGDILIVFDGGGGTDNMIYQAIKLKLHIFKMNEMVDFEEEFC